MHFISGFRPRNSIVALRQHWQLILSMLWAIGLIATAYIVYSPVFQTNDDVTMAMRVHGFGQFASATPYIVYSNILWGVLLYALPSIAGYLAYAWVTMMLMFCISWGITYFLLRSPVPPGIALLLSTAVLIEPLLSPQFTVTAGLCAVVCMLAVQRYRTAPSPWLIGVIVLSALAAILVRIVMLPLVVVLVAPYFWLHGRALIRQVALVRAVIGIIVFGTCTLVANAVAYQQQPEVARFHELYRLYQPLFNNGAMNFFRLHPELVERSGYSMNDLALMAQRFFVPGSLTDAVPLRNLMSSYTPVNGEFANFTQVFTSSINQLSYQPYPFFFAIALMCIALNRDLNAVFGYVLLALVIVCMCLTGRIVHDRVSYSMMSALLLFAVTHVLAPNWKKIYAWSSIGALVLALVWSQGTTRTAINQKASKIHSIFVKDLKNVPTQSFVVWGASAFAFQQIYPLKAMRDTAVPLGIYTLALSSIQPQSVAYEQRAAGFDIAQALRSPEGVLISYPKSFRNGLDTFCREHYGGPLQEEVFWKGKAITLLRIRCGSSDTP